MALQTVLWSSTCKLECSCPLPSNVELCLVDDSKTAQLTCPTTNLSVTATPFPWTTIPAQISDFQTLFDGCNRRFYRYSFTYDESYLLPDTVLVTADITGALCNDGRCLLTWIQQVVGNDVTVEKISVEGQLDKVKITNQHGCAFEFPLISISSDAGNLLTLGTDGGIFLNCVAIDPCLG